MCNSWESSLLGCLPTLWDTRKMSSEKKSSLPNLISSWLGGGGWVVIVRTRCPGGPELKSLHRPPRRLHKLTIFSHHRVTKHYSHRVMKITYLSRLQINCTEHQNWTRVAAWTKIDDITIVTVACSFTVSQCFPFLMENKCINIFSKLLRNSLKILFLNCYPTFL